MVAAALLFRNLWTLVCFEIWNFNFPFSETSSCCQSEVLLLPSSAILDPFLLQSSSRHHTGLKSCLGFLRSLQSSLWSRMLLKEQPAFSHPGLLGEVVEVAASKPSLSSVNGSRGWIPWSWLRWPRIQPSEVIDGWRWPPLTRVPSGNPANLRWQDSYVQGIFFFLIFVNFY